MIDPKPAATRRAQRPEAEHRPLLPEETSPRQAQDPQPDVSDGSLRSHLWYGLGALAFVTPFFIPGIPRREAFAAYLAIGALLMIAPMTWAIIRGMHDALRKPRARRRRAKRLSA